jgi:hypothetical protein
MAGDVGGKREEGESGGRGTSSSSRGSNIVAIVLFGGEGVSVVVECVEFAS